MPHRTPTLPDLRTVHPNAAPVIDQVDDRAYCRRCGCDVMVIPAVLAGLLPDPAHTCGEPSPEAVRAAPLTMLPLDRVFA